MSSPVHRAIAVPRLGRRRDGIGAVLASLILLVAAAPPAQARCGEVTVSPCDEDSPVSMTEWSVPKAWENPAAADDGVVQTGLDEGSADRSDAGLVIHPGGDAAKPAHPTVVTPLF